MSWELLEVTKESECITDNSGVYTVINWTKDEKIRVDLMTDDDQPIISWQSDNAEALRKEIILVLHAEEYFSHEHASYIGAELIKCSLLKSDYIQN